MHGVSTPNELEAARSSCAAVLGDQIVAGGPKVIIAGGRVAADSLKDIGLLRRPWSAFRHTLRRMPHREEAILDTGAATSVFVTYHASARSVNQTAAGFYAEDVETLLERRLAELPTAGEARRFLRLYDENTTPGRGMRVLLLHWLDIGEAIRLAHDPP